MSNYDNVVYPVLQAANIPDIGTFPSTPIGLHEQGVDAVLVATNCLECRSCDPAEAAGSLLEHRLHRPSRDGYHSGVRRLIQAGGKYAGVKVSPAQDISATTTDFAPTIAILDGQGVDCLGFGLSQGDSQASSPPSRNSGHPMKVTFVAANVSSSTLQAVGRTPTA